MSLIAGKYEIIRELGSGSTGAVYLVRHIDLNIQYALKLLSREYSADERFITRFKREAAVLESFLHPGSIHLRDFGRTFDGLYYMTMDYCPGIPLKELIEDRGHLSVQESLSLILQILDVVGAAHQAQIIHRDLKPDNIMIETSEDGILYARILDFGIAKIKQEIELTSSITMEGATVGTPWYMSPEQAAGELVVDNRLDLYSLGIVLYELLSGTLPFKGTTVVQTLLMHLTQPPPPLPPSLEVPNGVEQIVRRALRKDPNDRYQSASDFARDCQAELQEFEAVAPAPSPPEPTLPDQDGEEVYVTSEPTPTENQPAKILCLDDNPMILDILTHILEREGYRVFTASDSSAIHSYLFQERVSLLVTDVKMPGIEGSEVCSMLKATMKQLKIILFSSLPERELEHLADDSHADAWISKNTKPESWIQKIAEVLGRQE